MMTKRCHKCGETKPLVAFARSNQTKDGLQGNCRECKRAYYQSGKAAYQRRHQENYKANGSSIRARVATYYHGDPEPRRAAARRRYEALSDEQKAIVASRAAQRDRDFPAQAAARVAIRRARLRHAAPPWLTADHRQQMQAFYESADALGMLLGEWHHVDHIVPVRGKTVCGLHVPWNLQVLPAKENLKKLNSTWPDKP